MAKPPVQVIIVGGGIGGLTLGLMLHARGIGCTIYEGVPGQPELGVGLNVLPHATAELAALGLLPRLDEVAVRTRELIYTNRLGQEIWREPRGIDAGYPVPQLSILRGRFHEVLREAVIERLGSAAVHTGHVFTAFAQDDVAITAHFVRLPEGSPTTVSSDVLVGCDGIHSGVRRQLHPAEGGLVWNGVMTWRGATVTDGFLDGRTMIVAGGLGNKLTLYPLAPRRDGGQLVTWGVTGRLGDGSEPPPRREDWNRPGMLDELLPHLRRFTAPHVDLVKLVTGTPAFYEYPMSDRDPLPRWTHGRVTLLGDAAHPMYPVGSNGVGQAILDARCLADRLASSPDPQAALVAYEAERLPRTTELVRSHRSGGPEAVIDEVERRAPDGFSDIDRVLSRAEREAVVSGYAQLAGFARDQMNRATGNPSP